MSSFEAPREVLDSAELRRIDAIREAGDGFSLRTVWQNLRALAWRYWRLEVELDWSCAAAGFKLRALKSRSLDLLHLAECLKRGFLGQYW